MNIKFMNKTGGRVLACSDIHGRLDAFQKLQAFLKPEDKVYFLGDAADRGSNGWEIIKEILKDDRFIYIKGNHEDLLVQAAREFWKYDEMTGRAYDLLVYNGGYETFNSMIFDEWSKNWIDMLDKLPLMETYVNKDEKVIVLSHAGCSPTLYYNELWIECDDHDLIWNRTHFSDEWTCGDNVIVVHGHTPIPYLIERLMKSPWTQMPGPFWYCDGHKVCIDNATFQNGRLYLLDLDTLDHHIIN